MKVKLILFAFLLNLALVGKAQISTCANYDGYWGQWKSHTTRFMYSSPSYKYGLLGNYSGFTIYNRYDHPSNFVFKFLIYGYSEPTKKEKKEHYKNNEWYEYSGAVEYYVTERYPTIKEVLKAWDFPIYNSSSATSDNPCVKRKVYDAKIMIAPYKKRPRVYNLWFDDVGIAIDMEDSFFPKTK